MGGIVILAITLPLRILLNSPFLPEITAGKFFAVAPGELESSAVLILGPLAKYLTVLGSAVVLAALYGLYGIVFTKLEGRLDKVGDIKKGLVFTIPPWLLHTGAVYALDGTYFATPVLETLVILLVTHLAYGATLGAFYPKPPSEVEEELEIVEDRRGKARRIFVRRIAPAAVAIAILIYGIDRFLLPTLTGRSSSDGSLEELYTKEITPTEEFYRTDIALIPPRVNASDWSLSVDGEVETPVTFTYDEFRNLASVEEYATLECISNPVGGEYMGTARWEGVRLSTILEEAGIRQSARYVVFYGDDGYSVAIPLETALKEGTILAYRMNGEPLNDVHGFPIRAIVPGIYGMMNAKWIRRIELVANEYLGYWQTRGWSNTAEIETTSVIKVLPRSVMLSEATPIAGIAFAGNRGISRVEVSTDRGATWNDAMRKDPLSPYTWVLWAEEWTPKDEGLHSVMVRATDGDGKVQTSEIRATFPDGATGYHVIDVLVQAEN
jgi:DMSO/TMAO reductase YedYZ molybdopterin-dependent catalytic subunit